MQGHTRVRAEGPLPDEFMRLLFQYERKSSVLPEVTQVVVWVLEKCTVVFTTLWSLSNL